MAELEQALTESSPEQIMFTTFTNAGAQEIAHRAAARFPRYKEHQFRYFRTLHSIGYRSIPHKKMMNFGDYVALSKALGLPINASRAFNSLDGTVTNEFSNGDKLLHLDALKRNRLESWEETAKKQELSYFSPHEIQDFSEKYAKFRKQQHKYDFTDQLEGFLGTLGGTSALSTLTHLFVDEAQDLSNLQWAIIHKISDISGAKTVIAGDDKQAIYAFNGGDPKTLIQLEGERKILGISYRLPATVLEYSETIARRIKETQEYTCQSNELGGSVLHINHLGHIKEKMMEGSWFILARNRKFLPLLEGSLDRMGVAYQSDTGGGLDPILMESVEHWNQLILGYAIPGKIIKHIYTAYLRGTDTVARGYKKTISYLDDDEAATLDQLFEEFGLQTKLPWDRAFTLPDHKKEQIVALEKSGELGKPPRIRVTTIHAVKGREADNVVLLPDLSTLTRNGFNKDPDTEHRVFYVGATRAKSCLYLHQPLTNHAYPL
jgi:superfamily I DNA/RNA helicase